MSDNPWRSPDDLDREGQLVELRLDGGEVVRGFLSTQRFAGRRTFWMRCPDGRSQMCRPEAWRWCEQRARMRVAA